MCIHVHVRMHTCTHTHTHTNTHTWNKHRAPKKWVAYLYIYSKRNVISTLTKIQFCTVFCTSYFLSESIFVHLTSNMSQTNHHDTPPPSTPTPHCRQAPHISFPTMPIPCMVMLLKWTYEGCSNGCIAIEITSVHFACAIEITSVYTCNSSVVPLKLL